MLNADHYKTPNWGRGTEQKVFRDEELRLLKAKKYQELLYLEVNHFKTAADTEGKFKSLAAKYNQQEELIMLLFQLEKYFGLRK